MLADTGYVDPDKVVIQGQSYGGYMTLASRLPSRRLCRGGGYLWRIQLAAPARQYAELVGRPAPPALHRSRRSRPGRRVSAQDFAGLSRCEYPQAAEIGRARV